VFRNLAIVPVKKSPQLDIALSLATRLLIVGLFTLQITDVAAAHTVQDNYDRLERAANLLRQGDSAAAETDLVDILRKSPRDPNALNLLGVIRAQQKRTVEAEKLFLSAIQQSAKLTGPYINLGRLYQDQNKVDRAIWAYNQAALLVPTNIEVHYQLAILYADLRDFTKALLNLKNIPWDSWRPEDFYLAVNSYLALNRKREALELVSTLQAGAILDDTQTAALGSVLINNDLTDDAIALLLASNQRYPNSFPVQAQLGAAYSVKKQWQFAEKHYLEAIKINGSSVSTLRGLAKAAQALGDPEKALAYLVQAKKIAPDDSSVLYDFAVTAFRLNLILDALQVAEQLYKQHPTEPAYIHLLAVSKFRRDQKDEAERLLRRYIQLRPRDTLGHYLLGITLYTVKRLSEARAEFEQSLKVGLNPDSEYMLGVIAEAEGDKTSAVRRLQQIKPDCVCYPAAQALLGTIYNEQNNSAAARSTLELATQLNPKDLRAHYQLGLVYSKLGEKEKAQEMFTISERLRKEQRTEEVTTFKLIDSP
jgi:Flp pilus assembly protein TadD